MNKVAFSLLCFFLLISCKEETKSILHSSIYDELRGHSFNMTSVQDPDDTVIIEFRDSTFTIFEYGDRNMPWRIKSFENDEYLLFGTRVNPIKQIDKNTFKTLIIGEKDYEIILKKRQIQFDLSLLDGEWIEEKYYSGFMNDSTLKPPPPPVPPPFGKSESDFQQYPIYKFYGDSIKTTFSYDEFKSNVDVSNMVEFLVMNIRSNYDMIDEVWHIIELTDSKMVVNRIIEKQNKNFNYTSSTENDVVFYKKR